ncbi:hypothetical protein CPB86DRAFT_744206 [Serendipita vermifera]|nr:hypothetical protein CPB86DRAFT_744206 [Serendipita vermifera]
MDPNKPSRDSEMTEIKTMRISTAEPDSVSASSKGHSNDAANRVQPKGPKDLPKSQTSDARPDGPPSKTPSKDPSHMSRSENLQPRPSSTSHDRSKQRPRSSSVDEAAPNSDIDPALIPITNADDFLIIERPLPAHLRQEGTSQGGNSSKESPSLLSRLASNASGSSKKGSDPKTWPPEALDELHRRELLFHQMKNYIDKLEERIQSQDQEISALNTALADAEHKLDLTRQDLNASRAFVSSEGTADAQHLIKSLREINSAVDDFAFRVMQEIIPDAATSKRVTKSGLEGLGKHFHGGYKINTFLNVAYNKEATVGDFVHPFLCYAMCNRLWELVFQPFVPGLDRQHTEIFEKIYALVHHNEPQERSARWRAITYKHAYRGRNDETFCEVVSDDFLLKISEAINPLIAPESITFENLKTELGDVVQAIFRDAIKLQDTARTGYMSFDYVPFMPPLDQPYHPLYMDTPQDVRQGGKGRASHAILTIGLGMHAWRSIVKEDKTMGKDMNVALKATVLCGGWNPNA